MKIMIAAMASALLFAAPAFAQPSVTTGLKTPQELTQADVDAWLDGLVPYAIQSGNIAGAVVSVVADGQVLTTRGFGYADVAAGQPVDPERTMFRPGSISKLFTWTAVMQQVERGALDLDQDVNTYLDFTIPPFEDQPITLRHILTHTAGFEEQLKHVLSYDAGTSVSFEEVVRDYMPARIYAPGTTPAYSNYATALAGYILQRVSGVDFEDYVAKNIFAPLGMDSATFEQDLSQDQIALLSKGYATATSDPSPFELVAASPAGALTVNAPDMAKFMLAHLGDGALNGQQILRQETAQIMHAQALATIPSLNGMALGFYESNLNGHRIISHGGDTNVFHSDLHLFVDDGVGLYISLNSTGENGAAHKFRALLLSEFADRYFAESEVAPVDIQEANAHLLAGQWQATRRSATSFFALVDLLSQVSIEPSADGKLEAAGLSIPGAPVTEWVEVEPLLWQARNGHERLGAIVEGGRATRISTDTMAPIIVYEPVPWQRSATWLVPALIASLTALALTGLQWPAAALVRRHHQAPLSLRAPARAVYHTVRFAALVVVATLVGWFGLIFAVTGDLTLLSERTDAVLLTLQVLTISGILMLGLSAYANAHFAFAERRSAWSKLWSVVLVLATLVVIWVAAAFNLFTIGTSY